MILMGTHLPSFVDQVNERFESWESAKTPESPERTVQDAAMEVFREQSPTTIIGLLTDIYFNLLLDHFDEELRQEAFSEDVPPSDYLYNLIIAVTTQIIRDMKELDEEEDYVSRRIRLSGTG